MRINNIKLFGYRRIALTGYRNIEIDFNKKMQLILGTNSSGKSSVMQELSPLPVSNNDLYQGGYKEISLSHLGEDYVCRNDKGGKCSLIRVSSNEELNPGGTQSVQKELIKQLFGYSADIHDLLTGIENFTSMSPSRRKEWLTRLSDVDYDYALRVYAALKERYRDTQGALKLARKKWVDTLENETDVSQVEVLKKELIELETKLETLNQLRDNTDYTVNKQENLNETLIARAKALLQIKMDYKGLNLDWCKEQLIQSKTELAQLENQRIGLLKSLQEKQDKYQHLVTLENTNIEALVEERRKLVQRTTDLEATKVLKLPYTNLSGAYSALESLLPDITDIMSTLPSNLEGNYKKERLEKGQEYLNGLHYSRASLLEQEKHLSKEIDHLEKHKEDGKVECPQCRHHFNPEYDAIKLETLKSKLINTRESLATNENNKVKAEETLNELRDYFKGYDAFVNIARNNLVLKPLWEYLVEHQMVSHYPREVLTVIQKTMHDIKVDVEIETIKAKVSNLTQQIENTEKIGNVSVGQLKEIMMEEERRLSNVICRIDELKVLMGKHTQDIEQLTQLENQYTQLKLDVEKACTDRDKQINASFQYYLMESIRSIQSNIGDLVNDLNRIQNHQAVLIEMQNNVKRLEEEEKVAKVLMVELSPTEGLIASGLMGFIGFFVGQMNLVINKVWSYAMNIIPPVFDNKGGVDLDYRFPFRMVSDEITISDIGKGSKGQQEIINLAFRIVACRYLHLEDIPIFADEFGTGFDEVHRKNAAEAIKSIVNESAYSQLFMISHYEDAHGSLTNAEVCVLSADNITVPKTYNQHVVFS